MSLRRSPRKQAVVTLDGQESRIAHDGLAAGHQYNARNAANVVQKRLPSLIELRIDAAVRRADQLATSRRASMKNVVMCVIGPSGPKQGAIDGLVDRFSYLDAGEDTDATGKRKVDGSLAATRLGQTTTERWANERFRQTMLLILEFRREWPVQSLLTADDADAIRTAVDNALYMATSSNHVGDIYDMNATVWAIWLVQRAHALKVGGWTVESADAQRRLSFESLYKWLEQQHSRRDRHDLRNPTTKKVIHRYVLPFKKMLIPPASNNMFKYRKGAQRLSDWITGGSSDGQAVGLAQGIIGMQPPTVVAAPPNAAHREARANAAWARAGGARQRRSRLRSVVGDSDDAQETRQVIDAVMHASNTYSTDSDDEMAAELEREMGEGGQESGDGAGPSQVQGGGMALDDIQRELMRDSDVEDALDEFERQLESGEDGGDGDGAGGDGSVGNGGEGSGGGNGGGAGGDGSVGNRGEGSGGGNGGGAGGDGSVGNGGEGSGGDNGGGAGGSGSVGNGAGASGSGSVGNGDEGSGGGDGGGGGMLTDGDQLSAYEIERRERILQNQARLKDLGLLDEPIVPPRPSSAPRHPRAPRVPVDGPRRESSRLQGKSRPRYAEVDRLDEDEEEEKETLQEQADEPSQGQQPEDEEQQHGRRSTHVFSSFERKGFSEQMRATIKDALSTSTLQGSGLEVVHLMSATQLPRNKITSTGVKGDADELDRRSDSAGILVSLKVRDFISSVLAYRPMVLWKWIAHLHGLDITALLYRGEIIGATIGFYSKAEHVYLTLVTATHRSLQGGLGVGLFLRRQQLNQLARRLHPDLGPLEVVSLSANPDGANRGAVSFQRHVFTEKLNYKELPDAMSVIERIATANPNLGIDRILQQDVTPMRFRQNAE